MLTLKIYICIVLKSYVDLWCLTPPSTVFQLNRGGQVYWWSKPEYPERTTDLPQVTDSLSQCCIEYTCHERDSYSQP